MFWKNILLLTVKNKPVLMRLLIELQITAKRLCGDWFAWLGHANVSTSRLYGRRKTRAEDSPTPVGY